MCPPNRGGASVGAGVGRGRGEGRGHETSASSSSSSVAAQKLATEVEAKLTIQSPSPVVASPPSSKALSFPVRPGVGTVGRRCVVKANHFLVTLRERILHHYDVTITPEVISRGVNRAVMRQLVNEYGESHLCRLRPVYDGRKGLFNAGPLPFLSKEFVIKLVDKDGQTSSSAARREREFKVAIKLASRTDLHHLQQFLSGRQRDAPTETIQVLDIVLRESPSNNCTVVRRSFFSEKLGRKSEVGDGMECWRGYYQSIRPTQMGMSLNIDVAATSFYESIPIVDYVLKLLNLRDPLRPLTDIDRTKVKKAVRGLRVELTHTKGVKRHKISGITSQPLDQLTFTAEEGGSRITVPQYFQDKYKIRLKYTHWPTLQDGSDSRPTYLLLEVCKIVEGQRYAKKLNEKQVTAILRASCQRPSEREGNIATMVRHNNYQDDVYAKEFGINVNSRLTLIQGARVIQPPMLKYHDTGREVRIQPRVGQWNMINTLYDIRAMKELESFRGHQKDVTALAWHPFHEEYFVSGSYDGSIFHWLVGHEAPQVEITGAHESSVWDLSWHHVDYLLCIGSNDHTTNFLYRNRPGDFASRDNFRAGHNQGGYGDQNQNPAFLGRAGPNNMAISEPPPTPGPFFYGLPRNEGTVPGLDSSSSDQGGDQKQQGLGLGLPPPPLPPGPHPSLLAPGQHPYQKQQHH